MNIEDIHIEKDPKIIFMGTPEFAVPVLQELIKNYKIKAVVTQPDKKSGRNGEVKMSPIKKLALDNVLLVIQPENMKEEYNQVIDLEPDLIITCAYGQILPKEIIEYPKLGVVNIHASLLPKLRGAAPIHRAIINGLEETGITLMYSDENMDEGDIIVQEKIAIDKLDTAATLHDKLSLLSSKMIIKYLPQILDGTAPRIKQNNDEATYALTIKKEDERLDFRKTKKQVCNKVRGLNSWPGSYCVFEGKRLKVWECYYSENFYPELLNGQITEIHKDGIGVKVVNGEVVLTIIQPEGKRRMSAIEFVNGRQESIIGKILS